MGRDVTAGQQAAVHLRVEGLDAAVADLRESGDLADADGLYAVLVQQFLGTARGDDLPAAVFQSFDKVDKTALVADTD